MDSPEIRPGNFRSPSRHERRKVNPIYKWLGLTHRGQLRHKEIRTLRVGISVGLVTSLVTIFLVLYLNHTPRSQSQVNIPGKRVKPLK